MDPKNNNTASPVPAASSVDTASTPNPSPAGAAAVSQESPATPPTPPSSPPTSPNNPPASAQLSQAVPPVPHQKSKPTMWVILLLLFSFVCGLALAGWYFQTQLQKVSPANQTTQAKPAPVMKKDLVIGTDATFPPMEYTASGEATMKGYDIDLGKRIGQEMGVNVTFKNIAWDDLFKALAAKQVDMIISSVTVTNERKQQYDFSDNYLNAGQVIIMRRDAMPIASIKDLQGKKIAVQQGTTNETEALSLTRADLIIRYPNFEQATKALVDGKADAILSDLPGAKGIVTENPTLKIMSDPFTNDYYGIVFRKGDPNIAKINDALSSLRTQGVLTDLKQKWLD